MEVLFLVALGLAALAWALLFRPKGAFLNLDLGETSLRVVDGKLEITAPAPRQDGPGHAPLRVWSCPLDQVAYDLTEGHEVVQVHRAASAQTFATGYVSPSGQFSGASHTVHSPGSSTTKPGKAFTEVRFVQRAPADTYGRLATLAPEVGFGDGLAAACAPGASQTVKVDGLNKHRLLAWLRHNAITGQPDEAAAAARFASESSRHLADFRARFGFDEGDLDHLRLDLELRPASYARLTPGGELTVHDVASGITSVRPIPDFTFRGRRFTRETSVEYALVVTSEGSAARTVAVLVSKPMWAQIAPVLQAAGDQVLYHDLSPR